MDSSEYKRDSRTGEAGFTLVEVIVAGVIMVILCAGILSVFSYFVNINRGENFRMQSLSVLQQEVEYYRSLKFVPNGSPNALNGGPYINVRQRTSADGRVFNITVVIDNDPYTNGVQTGGDATCKFKEIRITAAPAVAEKADSWNTTPETTIAIQRVRYN